MRVLLLFIFAISLVNCSGSGQRASAEIAAKNYIAGKLSGTPVDFQRFDKIDGLRTTVSSAEHYEYDFAYEVRFPDGFNAACVNHEQDLGCEFAGSHFLKPLSPNDSLRFKGSVDLLKKESGWVAQSVSISGATTCNMLTGCDKN